jgi:hypothetical protein
VGRLAKRPCADDVGAYGPLALKTTRPTWSEVDGRQRAHRRLIGCSVVTGIEGTASVGLAATPKLLLVLCLGRINGNIVESLNFAG